MENKNKKMVKLISRCTECGSSQGVFNNEEELRLKIASKKRCESCGAVFGFLPDEKIWNLRWETVSSNKELGFWNMIHEQITKVAKKRFEAEQYADAAESAFKEVNSRVKRIVKSKTGEELDGADLMFVAFPSKNPVIILDDLSTESGRNIQKGYMHVFAGAMMAVRNPKSHANLDISPERSIHFIYLASLLMQKLDEAKN